MKPTLKNKDLLRVRLGISQPDFADYLGVTRSQLAMHEQGSRSLPTEALMKLAKMETTLHSMEQSGGAKTFQPPLHTKMKTKHEAIKIKLNDQLEDCTDRLNSIQRRLDKMNAENTRAETWWKLLNKMMEKLPAGENKKEDLSWLEKQKNQTVNKMIRHGIAAQAKLQVASQSLHAEVKACKTLLKKMSDV